MANHPANHRETGEAATTPASDPAWQLILAAAATSRAGFDRSRAGAFVLEDMQRLVPAAPDDPRVALHWQPGRGWVSALEPDGPGAQLFELYLPVASACAEQPLTVGHLGQSLDGFIATSTGDSYYVTGEANVRHLHRMRALCDAVIVGAGTIAADDPQLTTRHVPGANPLRVVIDRTRRLDNQYGVFNDGQAATVIACAEDAQEAWPASSQVDVIRIPVHDGRLDLRHLVGELRERGCARIFVEGGGITVSAFLEAGLLDRLQVAVAPLIIGEGRPAIRLPAPLTLGECLRPQQRVFRMGRDILFECVFTPQAETASERRDDGIERIL